MTIDRLAVRRLLARARQEVEEGHLPSVQVALGYRGELVAFETFGDATDETRYVVFSVTKAVVAAAVWSLMGEGAVDISRPVVDYVPDFGTNGKEIITVEQVMLHTSGFPQPEARMDATVGDTSAGRCAAFARWGLNWEPGSRYQYHASSAHWVLVEIIERVTGLDFGDAVAERVSTPAGLGRLVRDVPHRAAELVLVGRPTTAEEIREEYGPVTYDVGEVTADALLSYNRPEVQRVGMPGGGGVMRAADLALFFQAVMHNPGEMWRPDVIDDVRSNVRVRFPHPVWGYPVNRTLGLVQAGGDGLSARRGLGSGVSPLAVGHNGAGGQIAWGDPVSGLSFGYTTNGLEQNLVRENRRTAAIATLAAACATA